MALSLLGVLLYFMFAGTAYGAVLFSTLPRTLVVEASPKHGQVLKAGEDTIKVTWGVNTSLPAGTDRAFKKITVKLCYAPISQAERAWRKIHDELDKDKTCQHKIISTPYTVTNNRREESVNWTVEKDVPTATYFIRAYAIDSSGKEVAYGQNTDKNKTTNVFDVEGISGRSALLDIAAAVFSVFSVGSLFGFFWLEKRKGKKSASAPASASS